MCNDDNKFEVGTQFVPARREWCTCLRRSRADGEDSGLPFGIFGRGRVSVDQTIFGSTFLFLRSPDLPNVPATVSGSPQAIITLDGPHVYLSFHYIRKG